MPIISFVNQKGGCAKSTTAVHFAVWLTQKKKKRVLLVDADAQGSSSVWLKGLKEPIPARVLQTADEILDSIKTIGTENDYVIIDGPAGLTEATRAILLLSDVAIVPCQPSGVDIMSAADAIRLVKQAQAVTKGSPRAALFISRAVKGTKLKDEAIALLGKSPEVGLLKSVVHQRQVIADAFGQSQTVWDMAGKSAKDAAKEYKQLFVEIMSLVDQSQSVATSQVTAAAAVI
ncbi:MAG: AAA family ATPase [Cyanobacteriota/Melainabacteria group bacterium]